MRVFKSSFVLLVILLASILYSPVKAQDGEPDEPYYIVQEGDSLWEIASRFGVSLEDLQRANNISDPGQVAVDTRLIIPGLKGVSAPVDTITVRYGETLHSLSRRHGLSDSTLAHLNRFVSPTELYAGMTLIVSVTEDQSPSLTGRASLGSGQSLMELAVLRGDDPWEITLNNKLLGTWASLPGDTLRVAGSSQSDVPARLPDAVTQVEVDPLLMIQGGTEVVKIQALPGVTIRGSLGDRPLNFFAQEYGYVALQGIHAMIAPGLYPLILEGEFPNGKTFAFSQNVLIRSNT
jgi:LysM repeat protein